MSRSGIPAPYGGACENCSRAKSKCFLRPGGACERCHRLNKTCRPLPPARRSRKAPGRSQIEEKLDEVVSLLRGTGRDRVAAGLRINSHDGASNRPAESYTSHPGQSSSSSNSHTPASLSLPPDDQVLTPQEAESLFETFSSRNLRFFPFVHFAPNMTATKLQAERPFLWLNITMIMEKIASKQAALGARIRSIIAQKLVIDLERSYDLVLGMLAYIGWAMHHTGTKPFLSMYYQMMAALVNDLGLNRRQHELVNPMLRWKQVCAIVPASKPANSPSLEQRRILLSAWLITAAAPSFIQRLESLRWNAHMDETLQALEGARECHNDSILVALVKTQLIADAAHRAMMPLEPTISCSPDLVGTSQYEPPPTMVIKMLRSRLHIVVQALSPEISSEPIIAGHIYSAELAIYGLALPRFGNSHTSNIPNTERLGLLYSCLETVKSCFTLLCSLPPADLSVFSLILTAHLSNCGIMLYRITVLDDPVWDRAEARNTIDLLQVLDGLAAKLEAIPGEMGIISDMPHGDTYTRIALMTRNLKVFWGRDLREPQGSVDGGESVEATDTATGMAGGLREAGELPSPGVEGMSFDFPPGMMDDVWFSEFISALEVDQEVRMA